MAPRMGPESRSCTIPWATLCPEKLVNLKRSIDRSEHVYLLKYQIRVISVAVIIQLLFNDAYFF